VVCATTPRPFRAVGYSYRSFPQTSDEEVRSLLRSSSTDRQGQDAGTSDHGGAEPGQEQAGSS
jgi:predicted phosphoribosyltransferase